MIFIVALVVAVGILAVPIRADMKKYGRENIIVLAARDIISFFPSTPAFDHVSYALSVARGVFVGILFALAVFAVLVVLWMLLG